MTSDCHYSMSLWPRSEISWPYRLKINIIGMYLALNIVVR